MRVRVGTAYIKYAHPCYEEAIKEGRLIVGEPEINKEAGEKLLINKSGRYIIEREHGE